MNPAKDNNKNGQRKDVMELFLKNEGVAYDLALEDDSCFKTLCEIEESLFATIQSENSKYLDSLVERDSVFQEEIDIAKAKKTISKAKNSPLPLYLKNYLEADFQLQKKEEDRLVIRFGKAGMKLLGSIFAESTLKPIESAIPIVRNSVNTIPQSVSLLEQTELGSLVYQVIQENEKEAYLSLKFDPSFVAVYNQVNLRKDNRFIYSSNINQEGLVSFSGLKEGLYNIEFTGKNISKRFELSLLADKT